MNATLDSALQAAIDRNPRRIAAIHGSETITCQQLDVRASQLAQRLSDAGAAVGTNVGIHCDRSIGLLQATLAVIKTGATCVPLDRTYPDELLQFMIQDAQIQIVVTDAPGDLAYVDDKITLPTESDYDSNHPDRFCATRPPDANDRAFIFYTSGTTGDPKGVVLSHRGVMGKAERILSVLEPASDDRWCLLTPIGFVAYVHQFAIPLLADTSMVVVDAQSAADTRVLVEVLREQGVTSLTLTPSWLRRLLEEPRFRDNTTLKTVFLGGEPLSPEVRKDFLNTLKADLVLAYGCTEFVWATNHQCGLDELERLIGLPSAGVEILLLNDRQIPVDDGETGEMYLRGNGRAEEYWNRPRLNQDAFVSLKAFPGRGFYRTGDRARMTEHGLQFVGRVGEAIKVNGIKIDLRGIEKALVKHETVESAVALVDDRVPGRELVAAFWTAKGDADASSIILRKWLIKHVQTVMIPSRLVKLQEMPLARNGKIDRAGLLAELATEATALSGPPETETEIQLANIWRGLLRVDQVDRGDQFFALGGDSLLAARAIAEFESASGYRIAPEDILLLSLAQLAALSVSD